MKKILICLIGAIILCNCEVSVQKAKAQNDLTYGTVNVVTKTINGMEYASFILRGSVYGGSSYTVSTVNLTKDKLEIEFLTEQLKLLKTPEQ